MAVYWVPYIVPIRISSSYEMSVEEFGTAKTKDNEQPVVDFTDPAYTSEVYSDVNSFKPSKNFQKLVDMNSVYKSVVNILNTMKRERFFVPDFGADLESLLMELVSFPTAVLILTYITSAIERWEPRVRVRTDLSRVEPDPDNHEYQVQIAFYVVGLEGQIFQVNKILEAA